MRSIDTRLLREIEHTVHYDVSIAVVHAAFLVPVPVRVRLLVIRRVRHAEPDRRSFA